MCIGKDDKNMLDRNNKNYVNVITMQLAVIIDYKITTLIHLILIILALSMRDPATCSF